jgi:hypothetical protein
MMSTLVLVIYLEIMVVAGLAITYGCLSSAARQDLGAAPAVIAVALPVLAFFLPKLALLHAVMLLLVPICAAGRVERIAPLYLFALMLLPDLREPIMIGSLKLWQHDIHISLGIGALAALLLTRGRGRGGVAFDIPFATILLVLVYAQARDTSATNFLRDLVSLILSYGIPYYVVSRGVRSVDDLRRVMLALAACGAILSLILLFEALKAWPMYRNLYSHYGLELGGEASVKIRAGIMRAAGPFVESTSMAFALLFSALAGWLSRDRFRSRLHYLAFSSLLLVGLFPPQSRGAWVGILVALLAVNLFRKGAVHAGRILVIVAIAATMLLPIVLASNRLSDLAGLSRSSQTTVDYRQRLFERGMTEVRAHPFAGQPYPQVVKNLSDLKQGEQIVDFVNTYLYLALIAGIPGLLLFVGSLMASVAGLWRIRDRMSKLPAAFVFAGLVAPIEMLAFTSFGGRPAIVLFGMMGFAAALRSMARSASRRGHTPAQPLGHHVADGIVADPALPVFGGR